MDKGNVWCGLGCAVILILVNSSILLSGKAGYVWHGSFQPAWIAWPLLFCGIVLAVYTSWQLWLHKDDLEEPTYTDEEVRRAKEELDQMYLREHGELPKIPPDDDEKL